MFGQTNFAPKFAGLVAIFLLLLSPIVSANPAYNIVDLSKLLGDYSLSATGINNVGEIILTGGGGAAYFYSNGTLTQIGNSDSVTWANGINDLGQVVGDSRLQTSSEFQAYLWSSSTGATIDPAPVGSHFSDAYAINNLGQVAGQSQTIDGPPSPFLYDSSGSHLLTGFGNTIDPVAVAINDSGEVVVEDFGQAFSYLDGTAINIGSLGATTDAYSINNSGVIVGRSAYANGITHAFIYDGTHLIDIDPGNPIDSEAESINDQGQVVGDIYGNGTRPVAFLYQDGMMYTLSSLLPLGPNGNPYEIGGNLLINNAGEIVCTGGTDVMLLVPIVPAPSSAPVLLGLLALAAFSVRSRSQQWR
ncbi:MAG TPA: hypothetical protein VG722_10275 [Tepidisphaeraceae bacterium]|nr:hypothetical protein [Tepidisphaeraceae bacterium]